MYFCLHLIENGVDPTEVPIVPTYARVKAPITIAATTTFIIYFLNFGKTRLVASNCEFVIFHWYPGSGVVLDCIDS